MPHSFLEEDGRYREVVLPNGLPEDRDRQKKVIATDNTLAKRELEGYLQQPAAAGNGENRLERKHGEPSADLPIEDYAAKTVAEIKEALPDLDTQQIQEIKQHEQQHKDRKAAEQAMGRELRRREQ